MRRILFSAFLFALYSLPMQANHLMGGSLTYQFLFYDSAANQNHYRVKMQLFRDCDPAAMPVPPQLPTAVNFGVYGHSASNPEILYGSTLAMAQDSLKYINPPSPGDSCSFNPSVCVQEGDYHADIILGLSAQGYDIVAIFSARNAAILNLDMPNMHGQTYLAHIPPSSLPNSSPEFSDVPVPFICTADTVSLVNLATDADGDSLAYSFVIPYDAYVGGLNPAPPNTINLPLPVVPYAVNYSFAQPFGPGGFSSIDSISGLTQYYIPNLGRYVVCIQIDEYRNGVLIASTRRDIQLIAISCPANPAPVLSTAGGSGITVVNITEGQTLCFPVTMTDPNNDSIYIHASGTLFDSTIVNPYATLPDAAGQPTVTGQFCWTTACMQGRVAPYQFTVSGRDDGCPPKIANVIYSIYVHPFQGPIAIYGPDTVCNQQPGVAYNVVNAPGNTYHWSVINGTQSSGGTTSNITIDWGNSTTGSISVYAVSQYGCTRDTISKTVVLKALPAPNAGIDKNFCSGQSVIIGTAPIAGYTYSWSPVTGLDSTTVPTPTVTLTNGSTAPVTYQYFLTATQNGCSQRDTVDVTVKPLPISPAINDRFACSGDTIHLGAPPLSGYTYVWTPSTGLDSTSSSNPTLIVSNTSASDDTLVYSVNTTLSGCSTGDTVIIIVHPLPVVSATVNPDSICAGDTAMLQGFGANTYTWANSLTPGTSIGSGSTLNVHPTITTTYIVTGTAPTTCKNTGTVTLFESPVPPVQATATPDSVCTGDPSILTVTGATSYWWATLALPNDTVIVGPSLTVTPTAAITYIVTGINAFGCINKDTITLALNPAPLVDSIYGNPSLCPGVTGVGYIALPFTGTSTYQWIIQSGTIVSGQGTDTVFCNWDTISGPGSISVIETTDRGCLSDTIVLPVNINLILTPTAPFGITPLCEENADSAVYFTFNTPGSVYTWGVDHGTIISPNGTNTIAINWDSTGTNIGIIWYQEQSTTTDTVCLGLSDTLYVTIHPRPVTSAILGSYTVCAFDTGNIYLVTPDPTSTYSWSIASGTITSGNGTNLVNVNWGASGTDTITVIQTNQFGCVGLPVDTTILINPLPNANAGPPVSICFGDTTTLNATGGSGYVWSPGTGLSSTIIHNPFAFPVSSTQYTVTVTDANNCRNKDSVLVTVNSLPNADAGNNMSICFSNGITLNATGGTQYLWTPTLGLSDSTIYNPLANPPFTTTYYVNVGDANNCHSIDSIVIIVLPLPVAVAGPDTIVCNGSGVLLQASGGTGYQWSPVTDLTNSHIPNPIASPVIPATYIVTVTDANVCSNTDTIFVDVNPMPHADFIFDPTVSCEGLKIEFTKLSTNDLTYTWDFGDGNTSTNEQNPVHIYTYGVPANISLIAVNNFCSDTMTVQKPEIGIAGALDSLSNVFTPNGDGLNECYQITPTGGLSDCALLTIFNRWGEIVFEASTTRRCWTGKNTSGNDCPEGVYFYVVKVGSVTKNGSVQLIRK